jgi:hypothetical protein
MPPTMIPPTQEAREEDDLRIGESFVTDISDEDPSDAESLFLGLTATINSILRRLLEVSFIDQTGRPQLAKLAGGEKGFMSFGIYIFGYLVVIGGLIYAAVMLHVPPQWIVVGAIVLTGLGILTGAKTTRQKDSGRAVQR